MKNFVVSLDLGERTVNFDTFTFTIILDYITVIWKNCLNNDKSAGKRSRYYLGISYLNIAYKVFALHLV